MKLFFIPKSELSEWSSIITPLLKSASEYSGERYEAEDILLRASEGWFQLWAVMNEHVLEAICVTETTQYPKCKEMSIVIMTGKNMKLWLFLLNNLENIARDMGCKRLKGYARPGWERIINKHGYRKTHVILEKDL